MGSTLTQGLWQASSQSVPLAPSLTSPPPRLCGILPRQGPTNLPNCGLLNSNGVSRCCLTTPPSTPGPAKVPQRFGYASHCGEAQRIPRYRNLAIKDPKVQVGSLPLAYQVPRQASPLVESLMPSVLIGCLHPDPPPFDFWRLAPTDSGQLPPGQLNQHHQQSTRPASWGRSTLRGPSKLFLAVPASGRLWRCSTSSFPSLVGRCLLVSLGRSLG